MAEPIVTPLAIRYENRSMMTGPRNLALCRDFTAFLQPAVTASLRATLAAAARPGGALVLGKAERPFGVARLVAGGARHLPGGGGWWARA